MKVHYLVTPLILLPLYAFSQPQDEILGFSHYPESKNTQVVVYSNEHLKHNKSLKRSADYPTQIIRIENNIENLQLTCIDVHNQIDQILVQRIVNERFSYAIFISCRYNTETNIATQFIIHSYFDPLSDEGVTYLASYLREYNNSDLLGTKFKIESAKGLIISLNIAAGQRKKPNKPPFIEYRKDRRTFYFKNNYEMESTFYTDLYQNFFTPDPDKILPFLNKWMFSYAGSLYKAVLRDSNYVELQPERIFLMENEEIFVSQLKHYFVHYCEKYDNHRCLLNPS